jgi:hypothetical protein
MQDLFYTLLGLAVIVLPIYFIVKKIKNKGNKEKTVKEKKEKIVKEKKAKTITMFATHIEGIDKLPEVNCKIVADNETLRVSSTTFEFNIPLERIINVGYLTRNEMVSKNKSVVGRAFAGSIIGMGALGALSGIGQKVKKETKYFVVFNYKQKDTEEIKMLAFGLDKYDAMSVNFVNQFSKRVSNEKVNIEL